MEPLAYIRMAFGQDKALPVSSSVRVVVESRLKSGNALVTAAKAARETANFILSTFWMRVQLSETKSMGDNESQISGVRRDFERAVSR